LDNEGRGKKRKLEASVASPDSGSANPICVIHMNDSDNCNFTFISNTKDPGSRFQRIKEICELRLSQPTDSPIGWNVCANTYQKRSQANTGTTEIVTNGSAPI